MDDMQKETKKYNNVSFFGIFLHLCCYAIDFMAIIKAYCDRFYGYMSAYSGKADDRNLQLIIKPRWIDYPAGFIFEPVFVKTSRK